MQKPWYWKARKGWYLTETQPDGTRKQIRIGDTKSEADDVFRTMLIENKPVAISGTNIAELIGLYITHLEGERSASRIAENSYSVSRYYLMRFAADCGEVATSQARPFHVTEWMNSKPSWGNSSRFTAGSSIRKAFKWAVREGIIDTNPLSGLRVSAPPPREFTVSRELHAATVQACGSSKFAGARSRRFRAILIALWLTGARPGELLRVKSDGAESGRWVLDTHKTKKKTKRARVIYAGPCAVTLARILQSCTDGRKRLFGDGETYSKWCRRFIRLVDKMNEKEVIAPSEFVLYSYRHTWITAALLSGLDVAVVAELAGTSILMIDRVYGHLQKHTSRLVDAARAVSRP